MIGSTEDGGEEELEEDDIHTATAGSSRASRHRSTRGKRDAAGSVAVSTDVAWAHCERMAGVALVPAVGGRGLFEPGVSVTANLVLR